MPQLRNPKKTDLLKRLINELYSEREVIGKELHSSKEYLLILSQSIQLQEKALENGKLDLSVIDMQRQQISEYLKVLQELRTRIFPSMMKLSGVLVGVKQYIIDYQKNHPIVVDIQFDPEQKELFGNIRDIRVYKSCIEIIDFMFQSRVTSFNVNLKCNDRLFEFEVTGKVNKKVRNKFDPTDKIQLVQAHLLWAGARIMETTNWSDRFKVGFKLAPSSVIL